MENSHRILDWGNVINWIGCSASQGLEEIQSSSPTEFGCISCACDQRGRSEYAHDATGGQKQKQTVITGSRECKLF